VVPIESGCVMPPGPCPISVRVAPVNGHPDEAAFSLWTDDGGAGLASGDIAVYVDNERYRVPVVDAVAADELDTKHPPTVTVVRFVKPVTVSSAYLATLDGMTCPVHRPYVDARLERDRPDYSQYRIESFAPDWTGTIQRLAAAATPVTAPTPETVAAPACARPYVASRIAEKAPTGKPAGVPFNGALIVGLSLNADAAVSGARMIAATRNPRYNEAAAGAALQSKYVAEIYRCEPVASAATFIAIFNDR
jgi:hypothetical protein